MFARRLLFVTVASAGLIACGAPPGFKGVPPGVDHSTLKQGCLHRAWAYKEPQNHAVWIDCLTDAGYIPDPEVIAKREELRRMGY